MTLTDEEIRVKVAELMGWKDVRIYPSYCFDRPWLGGIDPNPDEIVSIVDGETGEERAPTEADYRNPTNVPDWLTDERAALQLCDRMHRERWFPTITKPGDEWIVKFEQPILSDPHLRTVGFKTHTASDPSLARAVTLCFLAAHSNEIQD